MVMHFLRVVARALWLLPVYLANSILCFYAQSVKWPMDTRTYTHILESHTGDFFPAVFTSIFNSLSSITRCLVSFFLYRRAQSLG